MIFVYIAAPSRVVGSAMFNQPRSAVLSGADALPEQPFGLVIARQ